MTTPNEELIKQLRALGIPDWKTARWMMTEAADALQSQAERIKELERESETHAKAYGLAIVERDNLHHELKVAQEGWRCECSTDDACRFARERDAKAEHIKELGADFSRLEATAQKFCVRNTFVEAENDILRAELAAIAAIEPVAWIAFADSNGPVPLELLGWDEKACKHAVLTYARAGNWKGTVEDYLLRQGWTLKPLFTHPMPAQDVTELVEALQLFADALPLERSTIKTCYAVTDQMRDAAHAALSKYKGAK